MHRNFNSNVSRCFADLCKSYHAWCAARELCCRERGGEVGGVCGAIQSRGSNDNRSIGRAAMVAGWRLLMEVFTRVVEQQATVMKEGDGTQHVSNYGDDGR